MQSRQYSTPTGKMTEELPNGETVEVSSGGYCSRHHCGVEPGDSSHRYCSSSTPEVARSACNSEKAEEIGSRMPACNGGKSGAFGPCLAHPNSECSRSEEPSHRTPACNGGMSGAFGPCLVHPNSECSRS